MSATAQSSSANAVPSVVRISPFALLLLLEYSLTLGVNTEQVVDAFTGKLAVHMPYDSVRGYFVEALLVISIIVITRLSFVRNVTINVPSKP